MKYYESLYIINPNYEQDRLDGIIKTVADKISEYGFSIINHHVWSKKRLAYSIQKHKYGTFVLLHFQTESAENLNRFERFMVLEKPIIRHQTVGLKECPEVETEKKSVDLDKNIKSMTIDDELSKKSASGSEDVKIDKSKSLSEKGDMGETPNEQESKAIETLEKSEEIVEVEKTENIKE